MADITAQDWTDEMRAVRFKLSLQLGAIRRRIAKYAAQGKNAPKLTASAERVERLIANIDAGKYQPGNTP